MKRLLWSLIGLTGFSLIISFMLPIYVPAQYDSAILKTNERNSRNAPVSNQAGKTVTTAKAGDQKIAYLTFDDGPSANNTPRILDILKKYNIKATFFVNGNGKKKIYKRIVNEGHVIGNHTYSHNYKYIYSSVSSFKKDVDKLSDYLEEITGKRPEIFRFPGGSNNTVSRKYGGRTMMKTLCWVIYYDMDYQYFDWNVSSGDAITYRAKKDFIIRSALNGAKRTKHAIILMHDAAPKTTTVEALPEIIRGLESMGFKFDVLTKDTPGVHFVMP